MESTSIGEHSWYLESLAALVRNRRWQNGYRQTTKQLRMQCVVVRLAFLETNQAGKLYQKKSASLVGFLCREHRGEPTTCLGYWNALRAQKKASPIAHESVEEAPGRRQESVVTEL